VFFLVRGIAIGPSSHFLERYWAFPFITPRERLVIQQREWREKKEKNPKREEGGPGPMMFPFSWWQALMVYR
jgi:hypothetical protein